MLLIVLVELVLVLFVVDKLTLSTESVLFVAVKLLLSAEFLVALPLSTILVLVSSMVRLGWEVSRSAWWPIFSGDSLLWP